MTTSTENAQPISTNNPQPLPTKSRIQEILKNYQQILRRIDGIEQRIQDAITSKRQRAVNLLDETPTLRNSHLRLFVTHHCEQEEYILNGGGGVGGMGTAAVAASQGGGGGKVLKRKRWNWKVMIDGRLLVGYLDDENAAVYDSIAMTDITNRQSLTGNDGKSSSSSESTSLVKKNNGGTAELQNPNIPSSSSSSVVLDNKTLGDSVKSSSINYNAVNTISAAPPLQQPRWSSSLTSTTTDRNNPKDRGGIFTDREGEEPVIPNQFTHLFDRISVEFQPFIKKKKKSKKKKLRKVQREEEEHAVTTNRSSKRHSVKRDEKIAMGETLTQPSSLLAASKKEDGASVHVDEEEFLYTKVGEVTKLVWERNPTTTNSMKEKQFTSKETGLHTEIQTEDANAFCAIYTHDEQMVNHYINANSGSTSSNSNISEEVKGTFAVVATIRLYRRSGLERKYKPSKKFSSYFLSRFLNDTIPVPAAAAAAATTTTSNTGEKNVTTKPKNKHSASFAKRKKGRETKLSKTSIKTKKDCKESDVLKTKKSKKKKKSKKHGSSTENISSLSKSSQLVTGESTVDEENKQHDIDPLAKKSNNVDFTADSSSARNVNACENHSSTVISSPPSLPPSTATSSFSTTRQQESQHSSNSSSLSRYETPPQNDVVIPKLLTLDEALEAVLLYIRDKHALNDGVSVFVPKDDPSGGMVVHNDAILERLFGCKEMNISKIKEDLLSRELLKPSTVTINASHRDTDNAPGGYINTNQYEAPITLTYVMTKDNSTPFEKDRFKSANDKMNANGTIQTSVYVKEKEKRLSSEAELVPEYEQPQLKRRRRSSTENMVHEKETNSAVKTNVISTPEEFSQKIAPVVIQQNMLSCDVDIHLQTFYHEKTRDILRRIKKREFEYTSSRTKAKSMILPTIKNVMSSAMAAEDVIRNQMENIVKGEGLTYSHVPVLLAMAKACPAGSEARLSAHLDARMTLLLERLEYHSGMARLYWGIVDACRGVET